MVEMTLEAIRKTLRETQEGFLQLVDKVSDEQLYAAPQTKGPNTIEESWPLAVTLTHISEARQFFAAETWKVLDHPGSGMGRTMAHEGRVATISRAKEGGVGKVELRQHLEESYASLAKLLSRMTEDDLEIEGEHVNPKFGRQTLREFIVHFIVEHDQGHLRQAQTAVTKTNQGTNNRAA